MAGVSLSVVIPTAGRPCLSSCVDAIRPQVDRVVLVAHNTNVDVGQDMSVFYPDRSPNISRMWNLGLDACHDSVYVAVLNDDVIVPPDWMERVTDAMAETGATIGYMAPEVDRVHVNTTPGLTGGRMTGYAWVIDQRAGLRVDETMVWWYSDNDIEWQARAVGGVVAVPGEVQHLHPNESTRGRLLTQSIRDRATFTRKWGLPDDW